MSKILRIASLSLFVLLLLLGLIFTRAGGASADGNRAIIYFFWGDGCPHCAEAEPFLNDLANRYLNTEIRAFEVWYDQDNQQTWAEMAARFGFEPRYVPTIFLGDRYWEGYSPQIGQEIEAELKNCLANGCSDAAEGPGTPSVVTENPPAAAEHGLTLPILGMVNLDQQSLAVSTLLISFVDGFNPCSIWVLTMLMALVVHTGSRRKIFIIGLIFLTVTAGVYALFIAGLFSVMSYISYLGWVQAVVAVVSLVFAIINIKDYFFYKEGVSLTISEKDKPGIYQRMRKVVAAGDSFWALAGATVVLAAGVSLVEFSCTAGFPVLWANLLTAQQVSAVVFVLLLLLYLLIYQLDEMAIFFTVVFTLKASRLEEKQGRILKLVGGMLMLTLAAVMLINPALMSDLGSSIAIFGIAFGATAVVMVVHRKILPSFGIWIGSEARPKGHARRKPARKAH